MRKWWALVTLVGCGFNEQTPPVVETTPAEPPPVFQGKAVSAAIAPAPLLGGALTTSRDGKAIFVTNPDANTFEMVSLTPEGYSSGPWLQFRVDLGQGMEPGRVVEDAHGFVHVVLRRGGAIATIDTATRKATKREVCPAPRGITMIGEMIAVACEGGELVTIDQSGNKITHALERDLHDVVLSNGLLYVTRFRSAEVLVLDANFQIVNRIRPAIAPDRSDPTVAARYEPTVAWKMISANDRAVYVLHQYATTRSIPIVPPKDDDQHRKQPRAPYGGSPESTATCDDGELVTVAITRIIDGQYRGTIRIPGLAPTTDFTQLEFNQPSGFFLLSARPGLGIQALALDAKNPGFPEANHEPACLRTVNQSPSAAELRTGIAFAANYGIASIDRTGAFLAGTTRVALAGGPEDTGHAIFHTATPAGIACMSCHPQGGEDGHTWNFIGIGARRTQSLRGGILSTAPFHWNGDMHDISQLAHDVFTHRMGGEGLTENQVGVLGKWIDRIPTIAAPSTLDKAAVDRGRTVFANANCASCHSGEHLTNNATQDVGTGMLQVPSLVNVGTRAPFMHDGCAATLMDRFTNPACGGKNHGNTGALSPSDLSDLTTFLESL